MAWLGTGAAVALAAWLFGGLVLRALGGLILVSSIVSLAVGGEG